MGVDNKTVLCISKPQQLYKSLADGKTPLGRAWLACLAKDAPQTNWNALRPEQHKRKLQLMCRLLSLPEPSTWTVHGSSRNGRPHLCKTAQQASSAGCGAFFMLLFSTVDISRAAQEARQLASSNAMPTSEHTSSRPVEMEPAPGLL